LGSAEDRREMQRLRKKCDAILIGASTLRGYRRPSIIIGGKKQPANIILTSNLEGLSTQWPFFKAKGLRRILVITGNPSQARINRFKASSEILKIPMNPERTFAKRVIQRLKQLKLNRLLVEGGGNVLWYFVLANAIDEYHVTLTPRLIGGAEAPTLVEGKGFDASSILRLRLHKLRRIGSELFLVYRR